MLPRKIQKLPDTPHFAEIRRKAKEAEREQNYLRQVYLDIGEEPYINEVLTSPMKVDGEID